jgi:hypothetical protein
MQRRRPMRGISIRNTRRSSEEKNVAIFPAGSNAFDSFSTVLKGFYC